MQGSEPSSQSPIMQDFVKQHRLSQRRSMEDPWKHSVLELSFIFAISAADAFITFLSFSRPSPAGWHWFV
ncbi:hypothetical protein CJU60_15500 [Bacillus sp. 7705b]|nr:hypothetical protein CJU60_15500 [Bacillus sp. 7705b]